MDTKFDHKILVLIPAYNEEKKIHQIVSRCLEYASKVIVYDDGSTDGTYEAALSSGATAIRGLKRGYDVAIRNLFQAAKEEAADVTVTLDTDGQHDPSQINLMLTPITEEGIDIVIGSRFLTPQDSERVPRYRTSGIKTIPRLTQVASYKNLTDKHSGFRAYSKHAINEINLFEQGMEVSTEILMRAKEKDLYLKEVPITIKYDKEDRSSQNPLSHSIGVLYTVMQFISLRHPLVFYSLPGIALLILASFYMSNAMDLYTSTRYISTNLILVSVGAAIVGVVLFATGVILYTLTALLKGRIKEL